MMLAAARARTGPAVARRLGAVARRELRAVVPGGRAPRGVVALVPRGGHRAAARPLSSPTQPVGPLGNVGASGASPASEEGDAYWWVPYAVMSAIGGLCFWFYRASAAHSNRVEQLDAIGGEVALDAGEKEELRDRNAPFLTAAQFAEVCAETKRALGVAALSQPVNYARFVDVCNRFLDRPLDSGHLLDRVAMVANAQDKNDSEDLELGYLLASLRAPPASETPFPRSARVETARSETALFLYRSLCCGGDAVERATVLYQVYAVDDALARGDLDRLVFYLARTGQIDPKKQVAESDTSFPVQTYVRKDAATITSDAMKEVKIDEDAALFSEEDVVLLLTAKAIDFH